MIYRARKGIAGNEEVFDVLYVGLYTLHYQFFETKNLFEKKSIGHKVWDTHEARAQDGRGRSRAAQTRSLSPPDVISYLKRLIATAGEAAPSLSPFLWASRERAYLQRAATTLRRGMDHRDRGWDRGGTQPEVQRPGA